MDSSLLKSMGCKARDVFEKKYTAENNYEMLTRIYRKAIRDHSSSK